MDGLVRLLMPGMPVRIPRHPQVTIHVTDPPTVVHVGSRLISISTDESRFEWQPLGDTGLEIMAVGKNDPFMFWVREVPK